MSVPLCPCLSVCELNPGKLTGTQSCMRAKKPIVPPPVIQTCRPGKDKLCSCPKHCHECGQKTHVSACTHAHAHTHACRKRAVAWSLKRTLADPWKLLFIPAFRNASCAGMVSSCMTACVSKRVPTHTKKVRSLFLLQPHASYNMRTHAHTRMHTHAHARTHTHAHTPCPSLCTFLWRVDVAVGKGNYGKHCKSKEVPGSPSYSLNAGPPKRKRPVRNGLLHNAQANANTNCKCEFCAANSCKCSPDGSGHCMLCKDFKVCCVYAVCMLCVCVCVLCAFADGRPICSPSHIALHCVEYFVNFVKYWLAGKCVDACPVNEYAASGTSRFGRRCEPRSRPGQLDEGSFHPINSHVVCFSLCRQRW